MDDSKKLKGKDLINIGIFSAIYFVVIMALAMLGFIPIFMPTYSVLMPLFGGIVFMLFLTKVKKFGMVYIMTIIMGLLMWLTGMSYYALVIGLITGLISEFILKKGEYKSAKCSILAHAVFCFWIVSNYIPLFFFADKYWSTRQNFGQEYIDALTKMFPKWMFPVHIALCFGFGILGGLLGRKILKKHFAKAGIV